MLPSGSTPHGGHLFDGGFSKKNSRMGGSAPLNAPPHMENPDMSKVEKSIVFRTRHQCIATFLLKNSKSKYFFPRYTKWRSQALLSYKISEGMVYLVTAMLARLSCTCIYIHQGFIQAILTYSKNSML